ncbi:MAG: LysR family transcriptional regulator [Rhodospirillales bacterium]|nr:LysR family transcriptional regulator [Rhodospirillales bacterium]
MDRLRAMRVFTRVVEANSFTAAADSLSMPRTTVTTDVQSLERHLNVRLLNRTTRKLSLTPDGEAFYQQCVRILSDLDDMESCFSSISRKPRGKLRVDMPANIGHRLLIPRIHDFRNRYPDVELVIGLSDRRVDLVAEGIDCAIRIGEMDDSSLIARRVGTLDPILCASPDYLAGRETPKSIDDLRHHKAINYISWRTARHYPWEFLVDGKVVDVSMPGDVAVNDSDAYISCGLQGLGLIIAPLFMIHEQLNSGALVRVMPGHAMRSIPISVVYPQNRHLSPKARVFADWVAEIFRQEPLIGDNPRRFPKRKHA